MKLIEFIIIFDFIILGFIIGLFNSDVMSIFKSSSINNLTIIKPLIFIMMFIYILIILGISYTSIKELEKGVNVE